jgi:hypothetical protein
VAFDGSGVVGVIHDLPIGLLGNGLLKRQFLHLLLLLILEHVGGLLLGFHKLAGVARDEEAEHLVLFQHQ